MTQKLTTKDLAVISGVIDGEALACKKARMYANTLTDTALAAEMQTIAKAHEERFTALLAILGE